MLDDTPADIGNTRLSRFIDRFAGWFTHYASRKLEWSLALYTVTFGIILMMPMESMATKGYSKALQWMSEPEWGLIYTVVGFAHLFALHVNGRAAWTPFARIAALFLNSQVFLALAFGFAYLNPYSTAVITYGFLGIGFCGVAIHAAALDVGREISIWTAARKK